MIQGNRKIPLDNCPSGICPPDNCPPGNCFPDNCHLGQLLPRQFPPRIIAPPPDNFHLEKLPPDNCTRIVFTTDDLWTILVRVIGPRQLCHPEFFYYLLFRLYIKVTLRTSWKISFSTFLTIIYFINMNMHFSKHMIGFPLG